MIARVCSYDGRGRRDTEVMFTMSTYEDKVYTGQIPDTKIDELFDTENLTDERIEKELKNTTPHVDIVFESECYERFFVRIANPCFL